MVLDWGVPGLLQFSSPLLCVGKAGGFKVREEGDLLTSCETAGWLSRGGPSSPCQGASGVGVTILIGLESWLGGCASRCPELGPISSVNQCLWREELLPQKPFLHGSSPPPSPCPWKLLYEKQAARKIYLPSDSEINLKMLTGQEILWPQRPLGNLLLEGRL